MTGLEPADFVVTNAVISDIQQGATGYTALVTPNTDGPVSVSLRANAFTYAGDATNTASNTVTAVADATVPSAVISSLPSGLGLAPYQVTLTFSEAVTGVTLGDLVASNITVSNLQTTDNIVYTFNASANTNGTGQISLPAGVAVDAGGNANTAASAVTAQTGIDPLTLQVGSMVDVGGGRQLISIATQSGGDLSPYVANAGSLSLVLSGADEVSRTLSPNFGQIQLVIQPTGGAASLDVGAASFHDATFGNPNAAVTLALGNFEVADFTGQISALPSFVGTNPVEATVTFSEAITGLELSDFVTSNLALADLKTTDNIVYTFQVAASGNGSGSVALPAGAVQDGSSNDNAAVAAVTAQTGIEPLAFEVATPVYLGDASFQVTISTLVDGAPSNFVTTDVNLSITLSGATLTSRTLSPTSGEIQLTLTPTGGAASVTIGPDSFRDAVYGNPNESAVLAMGNFDATAPTAVLSDLPTSVGPTPVGMTLTFSEAISGLEADDFLTTNLTISNPLTTDNVIYTFSVMAAGTGTGRVSLPADVVVDGSGNGNVAVAAVTAPAGISALTFEMGPLVALAGGEYEVTIATLSSGSVSNFVETAGSVSITLSGATEVSRTLSPNLGRIQLVIRPTGGAASVSIGPDSLRDATFLIPNERAALSLGSFDLAQPAPVVRYTGYSRVEPFFATIDFGEDVVGFALDDITVASASVRGFQALSAQIYSVEIVPADELSDPGIEIPAGIAEDAAGNANLASAPVTPPQPDGAAPTLNISGVPQAFAGPMTTTITFDWGEPVDNFLSDDITVAGGTLGPMTGGQEVWTAELTLQGDMNVTVAVRDGAVSDGSGTLSAAMAVTGTHTTNEVAEEIIRNFFGARSTALLAAQPSLGGLLDKAAPSGTVSVSRGNGTVQFQSGSDGPVWAALNSNWSTLGDLETTYTHLTFGAHTYLQDETILGVMLQYDHAVSSAGMANIEGTGWLVGPYYAARYGDLELDARLLWGRTSNDISPIGLATDTFESERVLAAVNLSGSMEAGQTTLTPLFGWSFVEDRSETYVDALSSVVAGQRVRQTQVEAGLDWTMPFMGGTTEFVGGIAGLYSLEDGGTGDIEGARGRIELGLRRQNEGPVSFDLGVYADGIGQAQYEAFGVDLSAQFQF